jgi:low temperature requirement protein LtrA
MPDRLRHGLRPMRGRDPHEDHRAATPLELLFDLTFVIAFGVAANELAHFLVEDHVGTGILGFCLATFAVSWAWINFSWFASAFDPDDWLYRLTTMAQMVGVLVLALGLPQMFDSLIHDDHVDTSVMVFGYVVMRVAMVFQWLRAAQQDPDHRPACQTYAATIAVAQVGWAVLALAPTGITATFLLVGVGVLVELAGPVVAETRKGGTPWHPHHIAERYGLLVIITLGEGLLGTTAALVAVIGPEGPGWSLDVVVLAVAGTAMTFGMWWMYFVVPSGDLLAVRRERSFGWGYGHIPFLGAAVAVGAGLHAAAYFIEDHSTLSSTGTVLTVAVPLGVYVLGLYGLYDQLTRTMDPFHFLLVAVSVAVLALGVALASAAVPMVWCLLVLAVAPWVTVVGYEVRGHRHNAEVLAQLRD